MSSHSLSFSERMESVTLSESRRRFVRRTYAHLAGAIAVFTLIEIYLFRSGIAEQIAGAIADKFIIVLAAFIIIGWIGSHVAHSAQSRGLQYAALLGYVVIEALIFVPLLAIAVFYSDPGVLESAAYVTLGGFGLLTGIVWWTKQDFSFLRNLLMFGGILALGAIFGSFIFSYTLGTIFSFLMVFLAGAAILYDTSNILHHYPEDRYVAAALSLFSSVALLFWYVLSLFIGRE